MKELDAMVITVVCTQRNVGSVRRLLRYVMMARTRIDGSILMGVATGTAVLFDLLIWVFLSIRSAFQVSLRWFAAVLAYSS